MAVQLIPLFPGIPGGMEIAVILLIAILLFGANKIPKLARSTGEAMGEFKKGREQVEQELQEMRSEAVGDSGGSSTTSSGSSTDDAPDIDDEVETETESETDRTAEQ